MKNVCVFCGSSTGKSPIYTEQAKVLGRTLVKRGHNLVYGGGSIGLMGVTASAVMEANGTAIGVIPHFLDEREVGLRNITELILVDTMHQRKRKMADLADGFIAMPGGFGTLEELAEISTWAQLGLEKKPVGLLNVNGYYDPLISMFDHMLSEGFVHPKYRGLIMVEEDVNALLERMENYAPSEDEAVLHSEES